ncbi:hypothetical protein WG66_006218, partial [Moniliophthora roreri]
PVGPAGAAAEVFEGSARGAGEPNSFEIGAIQPPPEPPASLAALAVSAFFGSKANSLTLGAILGSRMTSFSVTRICPISTNSSLKSLNKTRRSFLVHVVISLSSSKRNLNWMADVGSAEMLAFKTVDVVDSEYDEDSERGSWGDGVGIGEGVGAGEEAAYFHHLPHPSDVRSGMEKVVVEGKKKGAALTKERGDRQS